VVVIVPTAKVQMDGDRVLDVVLGDTFSGTQASGGTVTVKTPVGPGTLPESAVLPLEQAIVHWTQWIRMHPNDPNGYAARGMAFRAKAEDEKAIVDLTEAMRLGPVPAQAVLARGFAWHNRGQTEQALADASLVIRQSPKWPKAYVLRGNLKFTLNDHAGALEDANEANRLSPEDPLPYLLRGDVQAHLGQYRAAALDYEQSLSRRPDSAIALNQFAWLLATAPDDSIRNGARAVELATRLVQVDGDSPDNLDTLAAAHAEAGDFDTAVEIQTRAVAAAPETRRQDLQERLMLYQKKMAFREEPARPAP